MGGIRDPVGPQLVLGGGQNQNPWNFGIVFTASVSPSSPPGNFTWVQLITNDVFTNTPAGGGAAIKCYPPENPAVDVFPGHDTAYPYPVPPTGTTQNQTENDNPSDPLDGNSYKQEARTFSASMYVMWTPTAANGCNASSCTIPVPLGYVNWHFAGTAKYASGTWTLSSGSGAGYNFVVANSPSSYPGWVNWVEYGGPLVCQ